MEDSMQQYQHKAHTFAEYRDSVENFIADCISEYDVTLRTVSRDAVMKAVRANNGLQRIVDLVCLCYAAVGYAGEVGELCNTLKKVIRDDKGLVTDKRLGMIVKEMGGAQWYHAELATLLGLEVSSVAGANIRLLMQRAADGTIKGDDVGDTRVAAG